MNRLSRWAARQSQQSWWVVPLQPIYTATLLIAGIVATGLEFDTFHNRLGLFAAHGWLVLGIVSPLMTAWSYYLILRRTGRQRYRGLWIRLGGDAGQAVVLAVFALMHAAATGDNEDIYVTVIFCGLILAALTMTVRDVWEIILTEQLAGRIHRDRHHG